MADSQVLAPEQQLPLVPKEVTSKWLTSILGRKVNAIEITNSILEATASKLFVTVTYDIDATSDAPTKPQPTSFCLKGGFNPNIVAQYSHIVIQMYQREVEFFNHVAPTLKHIDLLQCYWAGSNGKQGICVLDDLVKQGMTFGDPIEAWSVERVGSGVEQLAGLHAGTWGVDVAEYSWLKNNKEYDNTILSLCGMWESMVFGKGRPTFPADWSEERITAVFKKHFQKRDPKFRCLLHGDPHVGNTFLDEGKPRFLDWQLIHVGSAFHDVAYFIVGALSVDERRKYEIPLLQQYLTAIARFGGPNFQLKDVMDEYRKSTLSGIGWMLTPNEVQSQARVLAMSERYLSAIVDHKAVELVESLYDGEFGRA